MKRVQKKKKAPEEKISEPKDQLHKAPHNPSLHCLLIFITLIFLTIIDSYSS